MSIMRHIKMYLLFCLLCRSEFDREEGQLLSTGNKALPPAVVFVTAKQPLTLGKERSTSILVDPLNSRMPPLAYEETRVLLLDHQVNIADLNLSADIQQEIVNSILPPDIQNMETIVQRGVVTLRGTVSGEEIKERAEEVASRMVDHFPYDIDNQLNIDLPQ